MPEAATNSTETRRLLDQVRTSQPGAVDRLLTHYRRYLRQLIALRLDPQLRARVDPSDVVQETQMEAVRRLDDYLAKEPLPFRLWLRQLAHDRLLMLRRQHVKAARRAVGRELALPDGSSIQLAAQLLESGSTPSEQYTRQELSQRVQQALAQLPDPDRELLLMRNFEGLSNAEVAKVLDITPATASQRYGRALLKLRKFLVAGGFGGSHE
ncbi:MAG TPA: sigma-70 family RNA polymerase sigma factor [Gemmataceae bacterium]|nr:sigma-70 family RNA polymerase sigma factor [Gemmataceae bacterium]